MRSDMYNVIVAMFVQQRYLSL